MEEIVRLNVIAKKMANYFAFGLFRICVNFYISSLLHFVVSDCVRSETYS